MVRRSDAPYGLSLSQFEKAKLELNKMCPTKPIPIFICLVLLMFSACNRAPSQIIDNKCKPPCWQNIRPGQTTEDELKNVLDKLPEIKENSIGSTGRISVFKNQYAFSLKPNDTTVFILFLDDNVSCIIFRAGDYKSGYLGFTFGKAVEAFGEPEFVVNTFTIGPDHFLWFKFGHVSWTYISAISPDRGIEYGFRSPLHSQNKLTEIRPETELLEIKFFDPAAFEELIEASIFNGINLDNKNTIMQPWLGYGNIESKYPHIP
jgi:hypothetical protein